MVKTMAFYHKPTMMGAAYIAEEHEEDSEKACANKRSWEDCADVQCISDEIETPFECPPPKKRKFSSTLSNHSVWNFVSPEPHGAVAYIQDIQYSFSSIDDFPQFQEPQIFISAKEAEMFMDDLESVCGPLPSYPEAQRVLSKATRRNECRPTNESREALGLLQHDLRFDYDVEIDTLPDQVVSNSDVVRYESC